MGIKFGEIDSSQILENEFRILVLERIVDRLLSALPAVANDLDIGSVRSEAVEILKQKYPSSGIELKG